MIGSMTILMAAGAIKKDDGQLMSIQGLDAGQAQQLANMLAIATNGQVELEYLQFMGERKTITAHPLTVPNYVNGERVPPAGQA